MTSRRLMALLVLASGLYRLMANRMRGYQDAQARQIFRDLIDMPADIGEMSGRKLADNAASFIGFYDFTRTDGTTSVFPARFAFLVVKVDGKWKIAQHHSSPRPKPAQ